MLGKLSESPVIILADAYFVVKQHEIFLGIIKSLDQRNLIIGLESQLQKLKDDDKKAGKLNYLPIFTFIEENDIPTFTHGPENEGETNSSYSTIDYFKWDKSLAEKTTDLLKEGKQVLIIIGDTHASSDHLPFLIEEISGINPALVIQNPLNLSVEQILEGNSVFHQQLTSWGLSEDRVLTIENDFYLNTEVPIKDLKQYIKLFNLENSLRVKQRKVIHRRDSRDK